MPTISVDKAELFKALGREWVDIFALLVYRLNNKQPRFTTDQFDELCFEFGAALHCLESRHSLTTVPNRN